MIPSRRDPTRAIDLADGVPLLGRRAAAGPDGALHHLRPPLRAAAAEVGPDPRGLQGRQRRELRVPGAFRERTFRKLPRRSSSGWRGRPGGACSTWARRADRSWPRRGERGYEPLGCEPSTWMCAFARERYGLDLHPGTLFDMPARRRGRSTCSRCGTSSSTRPDPKAVLAPRARAADARRRARHVVSRLRQPRRAAARRALAVPAHRAPLLLHARDDDRAAARDAASSRWATRRTCRPSSSATSPSARRPTSARSAGLVHRAAARAAAATGCRSSTGWARPWSWRERRPGSRDARGPVVVLGGGVAGLAAGYYLSRAGFPVTVVERAPVARRAVRQLPEPTASRSTTGRTSSTRSCPGSSTRSARLLGDRLIEHKKKNRIRLLGRYLDYPLCLGNLLPLLGPVRAAKLGLGYAGAMAGGRPRRRAGAPTRSTSCGASAAACTSWSSSRWPGRCGAIPKLLSADLARARIPSGGASELILRLLKLKETTENEDAPFFYYPRAGSACSRSGWRRRSAPRAAGSSPARRRCALERDGARVTAVEVSRDGKTERLPCETLVSSIPLHALAGLLFPGDADVAADVARLRLRDLALVFLFLAPRAAGGRPLDLLPRAAVSVQPDVRAEVDGPRPGPEGAHRDLLRLHLRRRATRPGTRPTTRSCAAASTRWSRRGSRPRTAFEGGSRAAVPQLLPDVHGGLQGAPVRGLRALRRRGQPRPHRAASACSTTTTRTIAWTWAASSPARWRRARPRRRIWAGLEERVRRTGSSIDAGAGAASRSPRSSSPCRSLAALAGSRSGRPVTLNLGPGDAPYVSGFAPEYEIDDKVATHWTTYHARVDLPLIVDAPEVAARLSLRARLPADGGGRGQARRPAASTASTPAAALSWSAGRSLGPTRPIAGRARDRRRFPRAEGPRPEAGLGARGDAAGRRRPAPRRRGVDAGARRGAGRGHSPGRGLAAPPRRRAVPRRWPWPWLRACSSIPGSRIGCCAASRWRCSCSAAPACSPAARCVARGRALPASRAHPGRARAARVPDPRRRRQPSGLLLPGPAHARAAGGEGAGEGPRLLRAPSEAIAEHGVWRTEAYGRTYAFPYSPAFHLPFAALGLPYDTLLAGHEAGRRPRSRRCRWSSCGRSRGSGGIATAGAFLMLRGPDLHLAPQLRVPAVAVRPRGGRGVPALALRGASTRVGERRAWLAGAALGGGLPARVRVRGREHGSVMIAVLAATIALTGDVAPRPCRPRHGDRGGGHRGRSSTTATSCPWSLDVASRVAAGAERAPSRYPVQSFWAVAYARTRDFFDGVYPVLAALGIAAILLPRPRVRPRTRLVDRVDRHLRRAPPRPRQGPGRLPPRPRDAARDAARVPGRGGVARPAVARRGDGGGRQRWASCSSSPPRDWPGSGGPWPISSGTPPDGDLVNSRRHGRQSLRQVPHPLREGPRALPRGRGGRGHVHHPVRQGGHQEEGQGRRHHAGRAGEGRLLRGDGRSSSARRARPPRRWSRTATSSSSTARPSGT